MSQNCLKYRVNRMPEQIIDIRERIEKMRIKFEDDKKKSDDLNLNHENSSLNHNKIENNNNNLAYKKNENNANKPHINRTLAQKNENTNKETNFPSVSLSVKNPVSSKILVILMLLQVFSNIGIFVLLFNVLE